MLQDARINFQPYDVSGNAILTRIFSFGRAVPEGQETDITADAARDGLLFVDELTDQLVSITVSDQSPTLRLQGDKDTTSVGGQVVPVCPVFDIRNTAGDVTYAVFDDGFVIQRGHNDTDPDALNAGHFSSVLVGDGSIFIGASRLSYDRATHKITASKLKHQIPIYLQNANLPANNVPVALDQMTVHGWVALARTFLSNDRLVPANVFPSANADWDAVDITTATGGSGVQVLATSTVYCDAEYAGGNSDGSLLKPYVSLATAMTTKLTEGNQTNFTFKLAPGVYTGAISINRTTATCSFTVEGSGADCTFVQAGATFAAGRSSDVINIQDFLNVTFKDFTVRYGKYGLRPRNCTSCTCTNVRFINCGSDGTSNRHDMSGTQAEQAAFWASTSTSDGGAVRIRSCTEVQVQNCNVDLCARSLRIQDSGSDAKVSIVSGNRISRCLESGVYCSAGSYTGTDGCINFKISGNNVNGCLNNGILLIGGHRISVVGNTIIGCASAGIQQWHGLDNVIIGNSVINCNQLLHNGVGALGDAHANIHIDGSTNIRSGGKYIALVHNNTICDCNQGRAAAVYGIRIGGDTGTVSYPQESAQCSLDGNHIDAATRLHNPQSIAVVDTSDPTSSSTGNPFNVHSLTGSAEISIESNTDVAAATTKISMKAESSTATEDRLYEMQTDPANSDQFMIRCTTNQNGTKEGWRFDPAGKVSFACGLNPITNMNVSDFQVRGSSWFRSTLKASGAIDASGGVTIPSGQTLLLNNVDQLAIIATQTGQIATQTGQIAAQAAQIATQAAQIAALQAAPAGHTEYFVYFESTEAGYKSVNPINGNVLILPSSYRRYTVVYGDGQNSNSATTFGLRIRLPVDGLVDGTIVEIFTNHAFNHNGAYHVAFLTISSNTQANGAPVGAPVEPSTRAVYDPSTQQLFSYADGDALVAGGAERMIEGFSNGSGRGTIKFHYVLARDIWVYERGSY